MGGGGGGGGYGPKIVCQKSSMGGSGQRLGLAMGSHEGVFFIVSKMQLHSYHSTDSQPAKGQSFDRGLTHLHTAQNYMF